MELNFDGSSCWVFFLDQLIRDLSIAIEQIMNPKLGALESLNLAILVGCKKLIIEADSLLLNNWL